VNLETIIEQVGRHTWDLYSGKFGDAHGGSGGFNLEAEIVHD